MAKPNILIVEDDPDIQQLVTYNLIKAGMHVTCADNGEETFALLDKEKFDAVILDLMLPGKNGLEICRTLREQEKSRFIPVIILTAKSEENDIITGLEMGADDYITKPFSPKVLIARLQAVLRRSLDQKESNKDSSNETLHIHGLAIDPGRHTVAIDGEQIELTATEFTILHLLARKAGWVFTRQQIIDNIRGYDYLITPRAVDVQIFGLRKKLGNAGHMVETLRGIGYRMKE